MPEKKKKKRKIFFILLIFLSLIFIFIIFSPLITVYSLPVIFKKIYNRELTFKKVEYSIINTSVRISDIKLTDNNNLILFKTKELFIDLNLNQLLTFKISLSSISLDEPYTFLEKKENSYSLPLYLENNKINNNQSILFNLPFLIEQIEVKNARLDIKENNDFKEIITELMIFIPGISNKIKEINPIIKGKIKGKEFNIKGKSYFEKNSIKNQFLLDFTNLNLAEFSPYIPPIKNIKIVSGTGSANLNIKFSTYKNRNPELILYGQVFVENLYLKDIHTGLDFIKEFNGNIKINNYDIFNYSIDIESINAIKGKLTLSYSRDTNYASSVFFRNKNAKIRFKSTINNVNCKNFQVEFDNKINKHTYNFFNAVISIKEFSSYLEKKTTFSISTNADGVEYLSGAGKINYITKGIDFEELELKNLNTAKFKIFPENLKLIKNLIIESFNGKMKINKELFIIEGLTSLVNLDLIANNEKTLIHAGRLKIGIKEIELMKKKFYIDSVECTDANFNIDRSNENRIRNLKFILPKKSKSYTINYSKKENTITIDDDFTFNDISGDYDSKKEFFSFKINSLNIVPDINITTLKPIELKAAGKIGINNILLFDKNNLILKIENFKAEIDKIKIPPIYINIKEISVNSIYSLMTLKEDKKLYLLSIFDIKTEKKDSGKKNEINIDKIKVVNGKINFTDYSLNNIFNIEATNINGEILNFPSNVYPEGKINFTGNINNRNEINFSGKIGFESGLEGNIDSKNILLKQFSPYSEKYISHSIINGFMDLNSSFSIMENKLNIDINISLDNLRMHKSDSSKKINTDLSKLISYAEDKEGKIKLNIPIKGTWGDPQVDFRKLFFNVFLDILSNSGKTIMNQLTNFKDDGTIEIVYFKPGTDSFLLSDDKIFSDEFIKKISDARIVFQIEGYVDKKKDTEALKELVLREKISLYTPNSDTYDELQVLKKIYTSLTDKDAPVEINKELLKELILEKIIIEESDYFSLTYSRVNKIKKILMEKYNITAEKIFTSEKSIYENPYISGIDNTIAIIKTGKNSE